MALTSNCPKCGKSVFESTIEQPLNSTVSYIFIRCQACGCVIGVMDNLHIGIALKKIGDKVGVDITK